MTVNRAFEALVPPTRSPPRYTATTYVSAAGMLKLTTCLSDVRFHAIRTAPPVPDADESSVLAKVRDVDDVDEGIILTTRSCVRSSSTSLSLASLRVMSTEPSSPAAKEEAATAIWVLSSFGSPATMVTLNSPSAPPTVWNMSPSGAVCVTPTV